MSMGNRPSFSREAKLQWAGSRERNLASGQGRTFFLTSLFIELIKNSRPGSRVPANDGSECGRAVHDTEGDLETLPPHFRMIALARIPDADHAATRLAENCRKMFYESAQGDRNCALFVSSY